MAAPDRTGAGESWPGHLPGPDPDPGQPETTPVLGATPRPRRVRALCSEAASNQHQRHDGGPLQHALEPVGRHRQQLHLLPRLPDRPGYPR